MADIIFPMERTHDRKLKQRFPHLMRDKKVTVLGIPDNYDYMAPHLLTLLRARLSTHLEL